MKYSLAVAVRNETRGLADSLTVAARNERPTPSRARCHTRVRNMGAALFWIVSLASSASSPAQQDACAVFTTVSLERAACLVRVREWKEAEAVYRSYRVTHRDSLAAALGHAEVLLRMQHVVEATQTVRKLAEVHLEDPSVLKVQAWLLQNVEKNPPAAGGILERVTRIAPGDADAWRLLGSFYVDAHRPVDGVRCFERAVALDAANAVYRAGLGRAYAAAGRDAEAAAAFDTAIARAGQSTDPTVFGWYGDFLSSAGRHEESIRAYSRALAMDPSNGDAWLRKATAEAKAEHYRDAERDALEARNRGASEREAQTVLVRVYQGLGDGRKARAAGAAVEAAGREEEERRAKWRRAQRSLEEADRLMETQRFAEALPLYANVIADVPDYSDAWLAAGICYLETGEAARGEESFRTYLRLQPPSAEGHTALGALLLSQKRLSEARAELSEALRLDPGSTEAKEALDALDPRPK